MKVIFVVLMIFSSSAFAGQCEDRCQPMKVDARIQCYKLCAPAIHEFCSGRFKESKPDSEAWKMVMSNCLKSSVACHDKCQEKISCRNECLGF